MTTLLIAEHDNTKLKSATLHALTAARELGEPIHLLIAGNQIEGLVGSAGKLEGVSKVLYSDAVTLQDGLAENLAPLVVSIAPAYSHIVAPASAFGKNITPRIAATLGVAQISDVIKVVAPDTFERPIYAGNAIATIKSLDPIKVFTVRLSAFQPTLMNATDVATKEAVSAPSERKQSVLMHRVLTKLERPELDDAKIVVSGGRALGSAEQFFDVLTPLAAKLNAAIGASRAAVDAGYVPNDYQVGQTGKIVAPNVYIAVGISGAIQHLAGMKESKIIVAINKDAEAPIFGVADIGLVADLFQAVPELVSKLPS